MAKTELELLTELSGKMDASKDLQTAEIKALKDDAIVQAKAFEDKIAEITKEATEKGASVADLQNEVKELKIKSGRMRSGDQQIKSISGLISETIFENKDKFLEAERKSGVIDVIKMETKTVANIASANLASGNYQSYLPAEAGMEPTGQTRFRDIFGTIQSETDFVQFPRANTPIGEGSFGRQTEGATKGQVDRDYTMVSLTLKPMAGFSVVSRQSLRNIPFLQSWLPTSLLEELMDAEDADFSAALVAAATGSSTTAGITVKVERLIHFVKNLRKKKYSANAIMIDPDIWADILVTKPNDYSLPNVVTIDSNGGVRVLGRSVYDVNWLTGGRVLVGDTRKANIVQSEGLQLRQTDSHASLFTSNETAFLLERTEGLAIFRPDAFITTTL